MTWSRRNCTYFPFFPRLTLNIDWIIFQDTIDSNCTEIFRMSPEMDVIFLDFQEEMVLGLTSLLMGSEFPNICNIAVDP